MVLKCSTKGWWKCSKCGSEITGHYLRTIGHMAFISGQSAVKKPFCENNCHKK